MGSHEPKRRGLLNSLQFYGFRPSRRAAYPTLVGLLASEFGLSSLLVVMLASRPASLMRQWLGDWTNLQALGYSGGGRPGIAPGSLYIGPPTGGTDHQRNSVILATRRRSAIAESLIARRHNLLLGYTT